MRVAFQGELGAFSEEAVRTFFGDKAEPVPRREFRDVGQAVSSGDVEFGALPVENTLAGGVGGSYDVLAREPLEVVGEVVVPVHLCVLGVAGSSLAGLRRVLSHPVALGQAVRFFEGHPKVEAIAVYDTAGAAREVVKLGEPSTAALASRGAAERYGLNVLAANVEDRPDNQTRFLIVARSSPLADLPRAEFTVRDSQQWKTTVLLETSNSPGALVQALLCFAERGINLSKLESRPADVPWTYRFFLEFDTEANTRSAKQALEDLGRHATSVRVLGSYPKAASPASVDRQPTLKGDLVELRPLRPEDWDDLYAVASDPLIWELHPARNRYEEETFRKFFRDALESGGALVAIDAATQRIIGSSRYHGYDEAKSEIEIGWTFLARSHWGGRYNGEMKRLMLQHAFRFVERVVFLVGPKNFRSQRAVERIGGVRAGTRLDDEGKESVVFEITAAAFRAPIVP